MGTTPPPPPDETRTPRHRYDVVECVYSSDKRHRAVLLRDPRGLFHLQCQMWDLSEWEYCHQAFWSQVGQGTTITDTLDNARRLAQERLTELAAEARS